MSGAKAIFPMVPGHEIVGIVSQIGKKVSGFKIGEKVGIGCFVDLIICTVLSDLDWNRYLSLLKRDGTMVILGIPQDNVPVNAFSLIRNRLSLSGSLFGGIKETQEMLDFFGQHKYYFGY